MSGKFREAVVVGGLLGLLAIGAESSVRGEGDHRLDRTWHCK